MTLFLIIFHRGLFSRLDLLFQIFLIFVNQGRIHDASDFRHVGHGPAAIVTIGMIDSNDKLAALVSQLNFNAVHGFKRGRDAGHVFRQSLNNQATYSHNIILIFI